MVKLCQLSPCTVTAVQIVLTNNYGNTLHLMMCCQLLLKEVEVALTMLRIHILSLK